MLDQPAANRPLDRRRTGLVLAAFFLGGAVPIQLVTLSFGYAQYVRGVRMGPQVLSVAHEFAKVYIPLVWLPALVLLAALVLYARRTYPDVTRRIVVGLAAGAVGTVALDAVRQAGVVHGWLPGDTPVMFGKMATGSADFAVFYPVGLFVHVLNGANFGLFYAFVWGKRKSYASAALWGTAWALIVELGMMTGPPMGPMVGLLGYNFSWPGLFLLTLVAHVFFGVAMGLLVQHWLADEDEGGLFRFLRGEPGNASAVGHSMAGATRVRA